MSTYLSGRGRFRVGQRVRYVGAPRVFYPGQREVQPGETGVVVHDFGWDYRYLIRLDRPAGARRYHPSADAIFDIRPGNSYVQWQPVTDTSEENL